MNGRKARKPDVDGHNDGFSFPRSRSRHPSRAGIAVQDGENLLRLYTSAGGKAWRTSLGWPAVGDCMPRRTSAETGRSVSPPATSRNPFGERIESNDGDRPAATAVSAAVSVDATPSTSHLTPCRGGGSPGNPFIPAPEEGQPKRRSCSPINPFSPPADVLRAASDELLSPDAAQTPSQSTASAAAAAAAAGTDTSRRTEEMMEPPPDTDLCARPAESQQRRATERLPALQPLRSASPPSAASNTGSLLRRRSRSPTPPQVTSTRWTMLDPPRKDLTPSELRAAWFGVSLGTGGRVTELKLVDNGLVGTLPNALGGLEMLRYLHLGRNTLSGWSVGRLPAEPMS